MSHTKPLKQIEHFKHSKEQQKYFILESNTFKLQPEETFLWDAKEEYRILEKELELLRVEQKQQNENLKARVRVVETMQAKQYAEFAEFNKFVISMDDRKKVALHDIKNQMKIQEALKADIMVKRKNVKELQDFLVKLQTTVEEYKPYEQVLKEAVDTSQAYDDIDDMISRCDSLMFVHDEMLVYKCNLFLDIGAMKQHFLAIVKNAETVILGLKAKLSSLARDLEEVNNKVAYYERIFAATQKTLLTRKLTKERERQGIWFMFSLLCKRRRIRANPKLTIEAQLDFIKDEVELLREVVKEFQKRKLK